MYITFIRPLLEYADIVWDNCSIELKNDIEAVQHEAARIVTGATKLCRIDRLMADLNWDTLAERRRKHRLIVFFKMTIGLSPEYLTPLIPQPQAQPYVLRNRADVSVIHCNTQAYASSFLPLTIRQWNSLPEDIRNTPTPNLNPNLTQNQRNHSSCTMVEVDNIKLITLVCD